MESTLELLQHEQGVILPVRARAGGRRNGVTGIRQQSLAVSVTQVPEGGKANKAIIALLAKLFGCSKGRVELLSGASSPNKRFLLVDMQKAQVLARLQEVVFDGAFGK